MPAPDVITLTPPGRSTDWLPRLSSWTTSPSNSHVTVCSPICGCGATSIGLPSVKDSGPKRSRKHHGPTRRLSFTGSAREMVNEPRLNSRFGYDCSSRPAAPSATHVSADTISLRLDIGRPRERRTKYTSYVPSSQTVDFRRGPIPRRFVCAAAALVAIYVAAPSIETAPNTSRLPARLEAYLNAVVRPSTMERARLMEGAPLTRLLEADATKEL